MVALRRPFFHSRRVSSSFKGSVQAGRLQLRFGEDEGTAPAAVGDAVIPFASDISGSAAGNLPAAIQDLAKGCSGFEEIARIVQFSADAQGALCRR